MSFSVSSFVTNAITITIIVTRSLVNWCFEPSQPLGIVSGLKETVKKRYTVERTNKAEVRPEEQSEKAENSLPAALGSKNYINTVHTVEHCTRAGFTMR